MSISIDVRKLDKVSELETALGLLQNPEQYRTLITELRTATDSYKGVRAVFVTQEAAERFLQEAQAGLKRAREESAKMLAAANADAERIRKEAEAVTAAATEQDRQVRKQTTNLEQQVASFNKNTAKLEADKADFEKLSNDRLSALTLASAELATREARLTERARGLNSFIQKEHLV